MSALQTDPWPSDPESLVTFKQVQAHRLPVSRTTAYRMVKDGILPEPIKFGRNLFWPAREIDAYLAGAKQSRTLKARTPKA